MPNLPDGFELRQRDRELGLRGGHGCGRFLVDHRFLGALSCLERLHLVQVVGAYGGVGQHGHLVRLNFEEAALHEHQFLYRLSRNLDAHGARLDLSEQRRMTRIDAQLAVDARQDDELRNAGEDLLLGTDDVVGDGVGVGHGILVRAFGSAHCKVLAFSKASSIVPTM